MKGLNMDKVISFLKEKLTPKLYNQMSWSIAEMLDNLDPESWTDREGKEEFVCDKIIKRLTKESRYNKKHDMMDQKDQCMGSVASIDELVESKVAVSISAENANDLVNLAAVATQHHVRTANELIAEIQHHEKSLVCIWNLPIFERVLPILEWILPLG